LNDLDFNQLREFDPRCHYQLPKSTAHRRLPEGPSCLEASFGDENVSGTQYTKELVLDFFGAPASPAKPSHFLLPSITMMLSRQNAMD